MSEDKGNFGVETSHLGCIALLIPTAVIDVSLITLILGFLRLTSVSIGVSFIALIIGIIALAVVVLINFPD